jgi:hypothetical protein
MMIGESGSAQFTNPGKASSSDQVRGIFRDFRNPTAGGSDVSVALRLPGRRVVFSSKAWLSGVIMFNPLHLGSEELHLGRFLDERVALSAAGLLAVSILFTPLHLGSVA